MCKICYYKHTSVFRAHAATIGESFKVLGAEARILDEVEDCDSVADRREEVGSFGVEEKVSLAVDRPQEVGKLGNLG